MKTFPEIQALALEIVALNPQIENCPITKSILRATSKEDMVKVVISNISFVRKQSGINDELIINSFGVDLLEQHGFYTETEQEKYEKWIIHAMKLLEKPHKEYCPSRYTHWVEMNEWATGGNDFCDKCIDDAVKKAEKAYHKKRIHELNKIKQLKKDGYILQWRYIDNDPPNGKYLSMYTATPEQISYHEKKVEQDMPVDAEFGYGCTGPDSDNAFRRCDTCGIILEACVTADDQEMEHWESLTDDKLIINELCDETAYELYELLQFIHQGRGDIPHRGGKLAKRIIDANLLHIDAPRA